MSGFQAADLIEEHVGTGAFDARSSKHYADAARTVEQTTGIFNNAAPAQEFVQGFKRDI
jgi:hypothetical protein